MVENLTADVLKSTLEENNKVVVKFGASWCGACKEIDSTLDILQGKYPSVMFVGVDCDAEVDLARRYNIKKLPTLISYTKGKKTDTILGDALGLKVLEAFVLKA